MTSNLDRHREGLARLIALALVLSTAACGGGGEVSQEPESNEPAPAVSPKGGYEGVRVTDGGVIEGVVLLEGNVPPAQKIRVARPSDRTVCGEEKVSDSLRVGPGGEIRDVIAYLDGIRRGKPLSSLPPPTPVDQKGCQYDPHLAIYAAGTPLTLLNSDPLLHNVHAYLPGGETLFNAAMPRRGMKFEKPLPPTGRVALKCDVHNWMAGTIWITDHPYVAGTDGAGRFSLSEVPPGRYTLKVWHAVLGEKADEVEVRAGTTTSVTVRIPFRR